MSLAMARAPHANDFAPTPAQAQGAARPRDARLRERIRALLMRRGPRPDPEARTSCLPGSSWPDSFFDVDPGP
jgi:hypothetical protein